MSNTPATPQAAALVAAARKPNFIPKVGIILGSGLGGLANQLEQSVSIPYAELPGFPALHVAGHAGNLVLGYLQGVPVACLQGRAHYYEGLEGRDVKMLVRTLKKLGCEILLITNASGSLRKEVSAGELVMITDHINFQGKNPLLGPNDEEFGPRFFPMDTVYDAELQARLLKSAEANNITLHKGTYISVLGPNFETPAEIRAFKTLGADVIGMSTVPEVLVAAHCGLRVALVAAISNLAAGLSAHPLSHEETLQGAQMGAANLTRLVKNFVGSFRDSQ